MSLYVLSPWTVGNLYILDRLCVMQMTPLSVGVGFRRTRRIRTQCTSRGLPECATLLIHLIIEK
jgi:hypothetical protein